MKIVFRWMLLGVLMLAAGCAGGARGLPQLPQEPVGGAYLLGAGDALKVTVFGEPDLSGTFKISDSGVIVVPLVGQVAAQGLSVPDLQKKLTALLNQKAVKSPDVTIQIEEYRPFFILGEVKNPGSYAYVPDMTVLTAVAIAGGFTFRASEDEVSVTRKRNGAAVESRGTRNSRVLPGDTVFVFERHF
ncbi:MAG TPA: polysaccharide biosynthesis/export family protein [Steroidobacteraceae bacterium]|nr:polysaccharide biosynthesis/export family protein [Steroidobacteraceae bacterium]